MWTAKQRIFVDVELFFLKMGALVMPEDFGLLPAGTTLSGEGPSGDVLADLRITPTESDSGIRGVQMPEKRDGIDAKLFEKMREHFHQLVKTLLGEVIVSIKVQTGISVPDATGMSLDRLGEEIVPVLGDYHLSRSLHSRPKKATVIDEEPIENDIKEILDTLVRTHGNIRSALAGYLAVAA